MDGNGYVDESELQKAFAKAGHDMSIDEVRIISPGYVASMCDAFPIFHIVSGSQLNFSCGRRRERAD